MIFNEMLNNGSIRKPYRKIDKWIHSFKDNSYEKKHQEAQRIFKRIGITFSVYEKKSPEERMIPFDMVPRVFTANEWKVIESGVKQRTKALNLFLHDIYNGANIIKEKVIPAEIVYKSRAFESSMVGFSPPRKIFSHISGIDIVRTSLNKFVVLEDNCRTPSGVSYMMQNREIMMTMFPDLFNDNLIEPIDDYPLSLRKMLSSIAPQNCDKEPIIVVLTPGSYNSAYYEHSFLADLMGVELVEGEDLFTEKDKVYMRTVRGPQKIDVIYRRIDDPYLDPLCFDQDSLIGVPGIMNAYNMIDGLNGICASLALIPIAYVTYLGNFSYGLLIPIGAILGYAFASMENENISSNYRSHTFNKNYYPRTRPGDFIVSLLVLFAKVMKGDKKLLKSEGILV